MAVSPSARSGGARSGATCASTGSGRALVVLSIAVGVIAVGTIAGANVLLERNLRDGYAATQPSSASLFTTVPFDQDLVDVVRRMPERRRGARAGGASRSGS